MNYNNLAQKTNYIAGSDQFKNIPFFITTVNVPGLNMNHPSVSTRNSHRMNLSADTYEWGMLNFEMLIDEDFEIYKELNALLESNIDRNKGTFEDFTFDFWIELANSKGNKVMKLEYTNCRIMSVGDIILDSQDDATEHTLSVEIVFDYFEIAKTTI